MYNQYIKRWLELSPLLQSRSVFLFGPRQLGKSSYLSNQLNLPIAKIYNLLDRSLFSRLAANPSRMRQEIEALDLRDCIVVIDEIQKCPALLDEVHLLIEERNIRFLLTGSSARALRRVGTNLLGGRARDRVMHPFVYAELRDVGFDLLKAMNRGLIPSHYFSDAPEEDLRSYVGRYLTEEIAAEGIARNIPAFARFLEVAAVCNAQMINYSTVAADAQVNRHTAVNYFQILKDTLLAFELAPFTKTLKRKAISTPKFYFFDMGIVAGLRGLPAINEASADFGPFFEHFIFGELRAFIDYVRPSLTLHYWRSTSNMEVDFILGGHLAIEVKSTQRVSQADLKGLRALREENLCSRYLLVCRESERRMEDGILILPWRDFLESLWMKKEFDTELGIAQREIPALGVS